MKSVELKTIKKEYPSSLKDFSFPDVLVPAVQKGTMNQTHYLFSPFTSNSFSFQFDLAGAADACRSDLTDLPAKNELYPYEMAEGQWWPYAVAPHSYLPLGNGQVQIGLNFFNRFLHIDFEKGSASLVDPGCDNEMLSTTNRFDEKTGQLWFASWPMKATLQRTAEPGRPVPVTIWKTQLEGGKSEKVWQGDMADSLHQLGLDPSGRFLIVAELGLRVRGQAAAGRSLVPSIVLIHDLETNRQWRLPFAAAAHVEFDPEDPSICYLSEHNIGIIGGKVAIFGPGTIQKIRLCESGPELLGKFTHEAFHRITTHKVFRHRGKTLIAVSGYPASIFFIDAASMTVHRVVEMDGFPDTVDTSSSFHLCRQDSYGIEASTDGEALLAAGTGFLKVVDIARGRFIQETAITDYGQDCCFTGHLGSHLRKG